LRDQNAALRACRLLLTNNGWSVPSWNIDQCVDPSELPNLRNHFWPSYFPGLAEHQTFTRFTHVYGTFTAVEIEWHVPIRCFLGCSRGSHALSNHATTILSGRASGR
jgi:hypothetical protein